MSTEVVPLGQALPGSHIVRDNIKTMRSKNKICACTQRQHPRCNRPSALRGHVISFF